MSEVERRSLLADVAMWNGYCLGLRRAMTVALESGAAHAFRLLTEDHCKGLERLREAELWLRDETAA